MHSSQMHVQAACVWGWVGGEGHSDALNWEGRRTRRIRPKRRRGQKTGCSKGLPFVTKDTGVGIHNMAKTQRVEKGTGKHQTQSE